MAYIQENKICESCKKDFTIELDDFGFYEKMQVPAPETCPQCRQQLRTLFRNFKTLYKRTSSKSGKSIISAFQEDTKFPVYDSAEWWGDNWDPMVYGKDLDFKRSIFDQINELFNLVPHISLFSYQTENCEYSNQINKSKNCYLLFGGLDNEDCDYGHIVWNCRDSTDNLYLFKSESCYECIDCLNCNKLFYSEECDGCVESIGLFDCRGCLNCIGCVGLVNKSYYIFNRQVSKNEYAKFVKENPICDKSNVKKILKKREDLRKIMPQRSFFGFRNNNVSGNHVYNARNIHYSFDIKGGENSKYCFTVRKTTDSFDLSFTGDASECYNCLTMLNSNRVIGSQTIYESHDVFYSENCYNSNNIFGCYGLRKKSYCILNKQYSKKEYNELLPRVIERMTQDKEWGNFFPKELSPFGYNEAIVNEYIPLTKEEALVQGFKWQDNIPSTKGQGTIEYMNLPKNPQEYNDQLMEEILTCENCEKNYKLINREINFYKKNKLAIPNKCFNCRHGSRMGKRNSRNLWESVCAKCGINIKTSYKPEDQKIYKIYCEKCYQQEIY